MARPQVADRGAAQKKIQKGKKSEEEKKRNEERAFDTAAVRLGRQTKKKIRQVYLLFLLRF